MSFPFASLPSVTSATAAMEAGCAMPPPSNARVEAEAEAGLPEGVHAPDAEADMLRCEVARLQAQLSAEKAARRRLQRARIVCPECDEILGLAQDLSGTGNAPTPHACTPRT